MRKQQSNKGNKKILLSFLSNQQSLDLVLQGLDLRRDGGRVGVRGDGHRHDGSRDAARASQRVLALDKHVGNIFVLAQQRQMEQDLERLGVGRHDDELRGAAVERLGGLVGAALELLEIVGLLHQVQNGDGQLGICQGKGFGVGGLLKIAKSGKKKKKKKKRKEKETKA